MNKKNSSWLNYDLDADQTPAKMGEYEVSIKGVKQKAFWYGGGWWRSIYEEDSGEIEVDMWNSGSFTPPPNINWIDPSINPSHPAEYEVCIDAPWPLGGPGKANWTGMDWVDEENVKVKITQWRPSI